MRIKTLDKNFVFLKSNNSAGIISDSPKMPSLYQLNYKNVNNAESI